MSPRLAAYQGEAKERLPAFSRPDVAELAFALAAETHPLFEPFLLFRAFHLAQPSSDLQVRFRISVLSSFSHPAKQFRRVEETVTAVNQSHRRAILEFKVAGITPFIGARLVPDSCHSPDAAHHAAADEPHDIDVMWPLVQDDAAAGSELMLHSRPVHELVIVPGIDHTQLAEFAALHDFPDLADRGIKTVGVTAQKIDAVFFRRPIHGFAFIDGQRHGLFDDHVLFVVGGGNGMLGVKVIRRRHVDRVHVRTGAHRFDAGERLAFVRFPELRQCVGARIRGCGNLDKRQR